MLHFYGKQRDSHDATEQSWDSILGEVLHINAAVHELRNYFSSSFFSHAAGYLFNSRIAAVLYKQAV